MNSKHSLHLSVRAVYSDSPGETFKKATSFADMMEVSRPVSTYKGLPAEPMEPGRTYVTDVTALGFAKSKDYHIRIDHICADTMRIETSEWGKGINHWLHTMEVMPSERGAVWIDKISINAGLSTPFLALFARHMYRHRHKTRGAIELSTSLRRGMQSGTSHLRAYHQTQT